MLSFKNLMKQLQNVNSQLLQCNSISLSRLCFLYLYIGCFKSNASYLLPWKNTTDSKSTATLTEESLTFKMLIFKVAWTIHWGFSSPVNKSLHATLPKICLAVQNVTCLSHHYWHCWNNTSWGWNTSPCSHPPFGLCKHSASINECQWVPVFLHGGIQYYAVAS